MVSELCELTHPGSTVEDGVPRATCCLIAPAARAGLGVYVAHLRAGTSVTVGRDPVDERGMRTFLGELSTDGALSRCHARVSMDETGAYVTDLLSTNGTWLNGRWLVPRVPLRLINGDHLRMGHTWLVWLDEREADAVALVEHLSSPSSSRVRVEPWLAGEDFRGACARELRRAESSAAALAVVVVRLAGQSGDAHVPRAWERIGLRHALLGRLEFDEWALVLPGADLVSARSVATAFQAVLAHAMSCSERMRVGLVSVRSLPPTRAQAARAWARSLAQVDVLLTMARDDSRVVRAG